MLTNWFISKAVFLQILQDHLQTKPQDIFQIPSEIWQLIFDNSLPLESPLPIAIVQTINEFIIALNIQVNQ